MSKIINFDYTGGSYTQPISIRGTNMPWRYECDAEWLTLKSNASSITIEAPITYDYHNRECSVFLYDRFDNKIEIIVKQTGYYDLRVECADSLVLYHSYYDTASYFNFYITVYGGTNQTPVCKKLKNNIISVWDNSDMYNDFILKATDDINGTYTIEHADAKEFVKYCKANKIKYDASKLKKKISIVQVSTNDVIGEMKVSIDGQEYKSGDTCTIEINNTEWKDINILSTQYMHVDSNTKYSIIDDRLVDCQQMANWVDYQTEKGLVKIKAVDVNNFNDRYTNLRLINRTNARQYIDISIVQKTSTKG